MNRACIYCRVSTASQSDGVSLKAQLAKCRALAKLHDLDVVAEIQDAGESAKDLRRPGVRRMLEMLDHGEVQCVVVFSLDRLTRSLRDWAFLIDTYFGDRAKHPSRLLSTSESIDTKSHSGRLVLNIILSVSQWEREAASSRTRAALAHLKARGYRTGSTPFGFDVLPSGKLRKNAKEQKALALIKRLRDEGLSQARICRTLDARNIPTKTGRAKWSVSALQRILKRLA